MQRPYPEPANRSSRSILSSVILAAVCCLCLDPAQAGNPVILRLKNGDKITGEIVSETKEAVVLATVWDAEITIPAPEIARRDKVPVPTPEEMETAPKKTSALPKKQTPKNTNTVAAVPVPSVKTNAPSVKVSASKAATNAPPAKISPPKTATKTAAKPAAKPPRKDWQGKLDVGMNLGYSERDRELYYARFKFNYAPSAKPDQQARWGHPLRHTLEYQATYGRTDGRVSANRMEGGWKADMDVSKRLFVYNLIGAGYDQIRKIRFEYEAGPGMGYHWIVRSNYVHDLEIGLSYQAQDMFGKKVDDHQERFFARLAERSNWSISRKLSFEQQLEFFPTVDGSDSFRVRFESGFRYAIWQNISLSLSIQELYDTAPPESISPNDLQVRSMIGISF